MGGDCSHADPGGWWSGEQVAGLAQGKVVPGRFNCTLKAFMLTMPACPPAITVWHGDVGALGTQGALARLRARLGAAQVAPRASRWAL